MKKGDLVRCLDTGHLGIVLLPEDRSNRVLVKWPKGTHWTNFFDLEKVDTDA